MTLTIIIFINDSSLFIWGNKVVNIRIYCSLTASTFYLDEKCEIVTPIMNCNPDLNVISLRHIFYKQSTYLHESANFGYLSTLQLSCKEYKLDRNSIMLSKKKYQKYFNEKF